MTEKFNLFELANKRLFMIAEISCNHMNNYDCLKDSIKCALASGANAVKLQSSTPECLTRPYKGKEFKVNAPDSPWHNLDLYELYRQTCTPLEWPIELINVYQKDKNQNGVLFSTPFSPKMVDILEKKCQPRLYKISSIDWNYCELIDACRNTGKQTLISLVNPQKQLPILLKKFGPNFLESFIPMYCISKYPAIPQDFDITQILYLKKASQIFGFSDHSLSISSAALAVSLGATVLEKHFKLGDFIKSQDAHFSINPDTMQETVTICSEILSALNSKNNITTTIEIGRSLYLDCNIKAGEIIQPNMMVAIRPGGGISPLDIDILKNIRATRDLSKGTRLRIEDFESLTTSYPVK